MANLEEIRASAERLVTAVSDALRLEIAIFDDSSNLFFCTPTYLKKKGRVVHAPFIREVIENGSVHMEDADCPDQYCVQHAAIRSSHETIICLPHELVVEITGGDVSDVDIITQ
mgnify:CR=1 FL=1